MCACVYEREREREQASHLAVAIFTKGPHRLKGVAREQFNGALHYKSKKKGRNKDEITS